MLCNSLCKLERHTTTLVQNVRGPGALYLVYFTDRANIVSAYSQTQTVRAHNPNQNIMEPASVVYVPCNLVSL